MFSSAIREDRFMTVTFGGIAPTVVTETTYLQYTELVEREKDGGIVRGHGVVATLRREKGHDIDAACGQLRLATKRSLEAAAADAP